jgi:hypothetical protein
MAAEFFTIPVSIVALAVSCTTLWFTLFRRGEVKVTRPTQIYFGPDGGDKKSSKIYIRSLLYSTSQRGIVIENMYVRVSRGQAKQSFSIWVHGTNSGLTRGSGLFVGQQGVAVPHHFLLPPDADNFEFGSGEYLIEVFIKSVGVEEAKKMFETTLAIDKDEAVALKDKNVGIYFDWGPHSNKYHSYLDKKAEKDPAMANILKGMMLEMKDEK